MGMNQGRQLLEPEARGLTGIVSELIRLDNLVWLAPARAHDANWVFDANSWSVYGAGHEIFYGLISVCHGALPRFARPMLAAHAQKPANRVHDDDVWNPSQSPQNLMYIALNMPRGI
jgi:hypothetical protein